MGTVYNHTNLKFYITIRSSSSSSSSSSLSSSSSVSSSSSSSSLSSSSSSSSQSADCTVGWVLDTTNWSVDIWGSWNDVDGRFESQGGDPNHILDMQPSLNSNVTYPSQIKVNIETVVGYSSLTVTQITIVDTNSTTIYSSGGFDLSALQTPEDLTFAPINYVGQEISKITIECQNTAFYINDLSYYETCSSSSSSSSSSTSVLPA